MSVSIKKFLSQQKIYKDFKKTCSQLVHRGYINDGMYHNGQTFLRLAGQNPVMVEKIVVNLDGSAIQYKPERASRFDIERLRGGGGGPKRRKRKKKA